jgi:autotransporter-associated beta strand protein
MKKLFYFTFLILGILSFNKTSAQSFTPDIVVDINGTGDFTTIQAAFDAVPAGTPTTIYVKRGLYDKEKLIIPANKPNITLIGESRTETIISYDIYNCNDGGDGFCPDAKVALWASNTELMRTAATLTILANDFKAENITIRNTAGPVGQAQALTIRADRNVFVNCDLLAYQDTIYFWMNSTAFRAYFYGCVVEGRTDYIYGRGIGVFNECEIRSFGGGWITAPSSGIDQTYGFVFYKCNLTYKANSPRNGDDGVPFRFGRPWHEYPKVAWLYCNITDKLNPEGWGDKWSMDYADTSTDLHLYEWMNTGAGADMTGRANWAGLRAMANQAEADLYEPKIVLKGTDNWDPTAIPPSVTVYNWDGGAANTGWLEANNWNPNGLPVASEVANVDGNVTVNANGGSFAADLNLINGAKLDISANSSTTLLTLNQAIISSSATATLAGNIKTKGASTFTSTGNLNITSIITGVHQITKTGTGIVQLNGNNSGYTGNIVIEVGDLQAKIGNSLGKSPKITVKTGAKLTVNVSNAIDTKTALYTEGTAVVQLDQDITINEWYINGTLQPIGVYSSTTNAGTISGTGKIIIGRTSEYNFLGGLWDLVANYSPALLPLAGEKVNINGTSIETTLATFQGDMYIKNAGNIRLRQANSKAVGPVRMEQGTFIIYATSGTGFHLNAPIILLGDITLFMSSSNVNGSIMDLPGTFSGNYKVKLSNNRAGTVNSGTVKLGGDNSNFTGTWDLTAASSTVGSSTQINGVVENAFGKGLISLAVNNKAIFSHAKAAGDELNLNIVGTASAVLNVDVTVKKFTLNGNSLANGTYNSSTHPGLLTGTGSIIVNSPALSADNKVFLADGILRFNGNLEKLEIYNLAGQRFQSPNNTPKTDLKWLKSGYYIISYQINGKPGSTKVYKK